MKHLKTLALGLTLSLSVVSCSKGKGTAETTSDNKPRPEKTSETAQEYVGKLDNSLVILIRSIGNEGKLSDEMTSSIEEALKDAQESIDKLEELSDEFSKDDFKFLERSKNSLKSKKADYAALK